jgi:hypothetical protein
VNLIKTATILGVLRAIVSKVMLASWEENITEENSGRKSTVTEFVIH